MMCAWEPLMAILPPDIRKLVDAEYRSGLQEIRLRLGSPVELNFGSHFRMGEKAVTRGDIRQVINGASRYSPWRMATAAEGYLTIPGGHRIGLCGEYLTGNSGQGTFREPDSLCIRVARDLPGIAGELAYLEGSVLILGAPGSGKTTLLRDLSRRLAEKESTVVVDERGELFPEEFIRGRRMDVLRLCPKSQGIEMALRTMGPGIIAVDEITARGDCEALLSAANCGVRLLATAHGASVSDLQGRDVYRRIAEAGVFSHVVRLQKDKSWVLERMVS